MDIIDLVPTKRLFDVVMCGVYGGREINVATLREKAPKWTLHFLKEHGEKALVSDLDELEKMGFFESFSTIGGKKFWRYAEQTVAQICVATVSGCTEAEILEAPEWIIDEMKRRGHLAVTTEQKIKRRLPI